MHDHTYKIIELSGSSSEGIEGAVQNAISQTAQSIEHLRWFEVKEIRGHIKDDGVAHYQVIVKIGFTIEQSIT
jgi:dodecin